jgi:sugar-specific transcriptional regulator TrmB
MIGSSKVMDALKSIGLNLYERRLWVALLARGTSTAGELSGIANVPRSRTYDILQSLADKGFVVVQTGKPIKYVAVPPTEALERAKKKMEDDIRTMQERIDRLKSSPVINELNNFYKKGLKLISPEDMTGALKGRHSVSQQLNTMFRDANKKISVVTTPEGLEELAKRHIDVLRKAKERGVDIKIATSAGKSGESATTLSGIAEIRTLNKKQPVVSGKFFIADGKEMIFSLTDPKAVHSSQDMALWSRSEYAAGSMLEPLFNLVWSNSKPVK